ncbi:ionotropic receptor 40a-like [Copidosoma floridanum]|uniref:ionotropic receptor 40a-like n=1 Tax=Copidosoma floridanum TaxID=29053 RepID=UPI000C6F71C7|nr:ionotropic receptor 40a-like [Copidosoma floridanum]
MLLIIAKALNFKPVFYQPENVKTERWGNMKNDTLTGLLGEAKKGNAVFYLGDLYYTREHLQILDLSWPYNTECLTFLTLESLSGNSWKLLVLPFRLYTWIAVILTLLFAGLVFFVIAIFYKHKVSRVQEMPSENARVPKMVIDCKNFKILKNQPKRVEEWKGIHLFAEFQNSILYTYSMLLQVSLPTLPNAWSLRVFIGWWWIFSILIAVTYRASMTASLANSVQRVTIDTLSQLVKSSVSIGSWNYETKDFFLNSSDFNLQRLGNRYVIVTDERDAIAAVSNGSLCYYENYHVLQRERVKRQILEAEMQKNGTHVNKHKISDHNLHVMDECVVNIPISLGMDKHSPLKSHVDKLVSVNWCNFSGIIIAHIKSFNPFVFLDKTYNRSRFCGKVVKRHKSAIKSIRTTTRRHCTESTGGLG